MTCSDIGLQLCLYIDYSLDGLVFSYLWLICVDFLHAPIPLHIVVHCYHDC